MESGQPCRGDADAGSAREQLPAPVQWIEEHYDAVYRYAYRLTGNTAAAEDVTQEVFIRAIKSWHQLREVQAVRGWLMVIARNEFARWCRKFASRASLSAGEIECGLAATGDLDQEDWVQRSLMELPVDYRLVVTMFYFEQLSYSEIAQELDIPIGTVMSRLSRAKKQLKEALLAFAEPKGLG
jgi:RNA polymerase sigma-70 factor, ECF subfamily